MNTFTLPPYPFSIKVFTDKDEYINYAKENSYFENLHKDIKSIETNLGETLDSSNNKDAEFEILIKLPKQHEVSAFDLEEVIDHEIIHTVFGILRYVGVGVGMKYKEHEHFAWYVNYLDREIKEKVYGMKDSVYQAPVKKKRKKRKKPNAIIEQLHDKEV